MFCLISSPKAKDIYNDKSREKPQILTLKKLEPIFGIFAG